MCCPVSHVRHASGEGAHGAEAEQERDHRSRNRVPGAIRFDRIAFAACESEVIVYVPNAFREERISILQDAIRRAGLATLVSLTDDGLIASHVPLLLDP